MQCFTYITVRNKVAYFEERLKDKKPHLLVKRKGHLALFCIGIILVR